MTIFWTAASLFAAPLPEEASSHYTKTHRAYVHSTEKVVSAPCAEGEKLVGVSCFGENVLMEPGEPEHVIALEVADSGCRLKKHVPEQMVRIETQVTCAK